MNTLSESDRATIADALLDRRLALYDLARKAEALGADAAALRAEGKRCEEIMGRVHKLGGPPDA